MANKDIKLCAVVRVSCVPQRKCHLLDSETFAAALVCLAPMQQPLPTAPEYATSSPAEKTRCPSARAPRSLTGYFYSFWASAHVFIYSPRGGILLSPVTHSRGS